jgi:excisionase family DNA binding protein
MTTLPAEPALLLTVEDTAKRLSISRTMVFKLLKAGDLASLTIGAKRLIPRQEIERYIRERTHRRRASTGHPETTP